jgi:hypothetical protein
MRRTVLLPLLLSSLVLAACSGGGGEAGPGIQPSSPPADDRITLAQYQALRSAPPQPLTATAQQASDYRFATAPLAASAAEGNTLLLPGLAQSRRALLMAAAQGETLTELQAQAADPQGLAAGVQQRELQALSSSLFRPGYLQSSEQGHAQAQAPRQWKGTALADWGTQAAATLRVHDSVALDLRWSASAEAFDGVFEFDGGARWLKPMWRMAGPVWRLDEAGFTARGLRFADGTQLVSLTPALRDLNGFLQNGLDAALLLLNQRLRAGVAAQAGHFVLAQGSPSFANLHRDASLGRAGDPARAQLSALNGAAQVARAVGPFVDLAWTQTGLTLSGQQSLEFIALSGAGGGQTTGGRFTRIDTPFHWPIACRAGEADLRPQVLLLLDVQLRLVALAQVSSQGADGQLCA